jgi:hypothetical protein
MSSDQGFTEMPANTQYLTPSELVARYKQTITIRTLANWRSTGEGPRYTKIGGRVLYPAHAVAEWENARTLGMART